MSRYLNGLILVMAVLVVSGSAHGAAPEINFQTMTMQITENDPDLSEAPKKFSFEIQDETSSNNLDVWATSNNDAVIPNHDKYLKINKDNAASDKWEIQILSTPYTIGQGIEITVNVRDEDNLTSQATITVDVLPINNRPIIANAGPHPMTAIAEDVTGPGGDKIADIIPDGAITEPGEDERPAKKSIAVVYIDTTNGDWQYRLGEQTEWSSIDDGVDDENALLLGENDYIRFVPDANYFRRENNEMDSIVFLAWDETQGQAGDYLDMSASTAISVKDLEAKFEIEVTPVNDAPPSLPQDQVRPLPPIPQTTTNGSGNRVSSIFPAGFKDLADGNVINAIAVTGADNSKGSWEYSTDGGTLWNPIHDGSLDENHALLLSGNNKIRFIPTDVMFTGEVNFHFRTWDETEGKNGEYVDTTVNGGTTAFSEEINTCFITVEDANHAPELADATHQMTPLYEGGNTNENDKNFVWDRVSDIIVDGSITEIAEDERPALESIAISYLDPNGFNWYYKIGENGAPTPIITDIGGNGLGDDFTAFNGDANNFFLLGHSDYIGFKLNANSNAGDSYYFKFRAWDETLGAAHTFDTRVNIGDSISQDEGTVTVEVIAKPEIDLEPNTIEEDNFKTIFREDDGPVRIAATNAKLDIDATFISFLGLKITGGYLPIQDRLAANTADTNIVADYNETDGELILRGRDNPGNYLKVLRTVTYENISQYPDKGQRTISIIGLVDNVGATSIIDIIPVNDAPTISVPEGPHIVDEDEADEDEKVIFSLDNFNAIAIEDVDVGGEKLTIEISAENGRILFNNAQGEMVSFDDTIDKIEDFLNNGVTYKSNDDYYGPDTITITVNDNGETGQGGPMTTTETIAITVNNTPDPPALDPDATNYSLTSINKNTVDPFGDTVAGMLGDGFIDSDPDSLKGIAVVGINPPDGALGSWEYSVDDGVSWKKFEDNLGRNNATLLDQNARIRFVPDPSKSDVSGNINIEFLAWDQSDNHLNGATGVNTNNQLSFSATTQKAVIIVKNVAMQEFSNIADAGADQTVVVTALNAPVTVHLNGSANDPDHGIYSYLWTQIAPAPTNANNTIILSSRQAIRPSFNVWPRHTNTAYVFQLTVTNANAQRFTDTCIVNVTDGASRPPVAKAGPTDRYVIEGQQVFLDALNSLDDGAIEKYLWSNAEHVVTIKNADQQRAWFIAPPVENSGISLTFLLTVEDNEGLLSTDSCIVNVGSIEKTPPIANAGGDQTVKEGASVTLDASLSQNSTAAIEKYLWKQTRGINVKLSNPNAVNPTFVAPNIPANDASSELTFSLTVESADNLKDIDDVTIKVIDNGVIVPAEWEDDEESDIIVFLTQTTSNTVGIKVEGGALTNLHSGDLANFNLPENADTPEDMNYGIFGMEIRPDPPNTTVNVTIYLDEPAPASFKPFKYSDTTGWYDFSDSSYFNADRTELTMTLVDGDQWGGDADGVANGVIVDPLTFGTDPDPVQDEPANPPDDNDDTSEPYTSTNDDGGCFINGAARLFGF